MTFEERNPNARRSGDVWLGILGLTGRTDSRTLSSQEGTVRRFSRAALGLSFVLFLSEAAAKPPPPDLLLLNGKVFTSDTRHLHAEALAILGDRIIAIGDTAKMEALAGPATRRIDLGGRTVIPGINDAHAHLDVVPKGLVELLFRGPDPTWSDVRRAVATAILQAPKGSLLLGEIGPNVFYGTEATRDSLDTLAPDNPIILVTFTGHAAILNSAALLKVGIREDQPDPAGGRYERAADGRLTGTLREYAVDQLSRALARLTSDADAVTQLGEALDQAAKLGVTSVQDMNDSMTPERCVALLEKIPTPVRVRVIRMPGTTPSGRDAQEGLSVPKAPASRITVSGSKWMTDGTPLEGTFVARTAPNDGSDPLGTSLLENLGLLFPRNELRAMLREALKSGDQLIVHVSGYPAAAAMLEAMEATGGPQIWAARRVRFEHGDGLLADLIPRVKRLGVVVVQNPSHLDAASLGLKVFVKQPSKFQPLASLLAAGIPVALGSDAPIGPFRDVMLAATHPDHPSEALTREQAVIASTLTAAYAEFSEKEKGSLIPGKLADLAVLSQDIFSVPASELPKTESVLTFVGGQIVYDAKVIAASAR
jgi:predicted amidohydrolase YtcJ